MNKYVSQPAFLKCLQNLISIVGVVFNLITKSPKYTKMCKYETRQLETYKAKPIAGT